MFSLLCQIKYAGSDTDFSASPAVCKHIRRAEPEEQRVVGTQMPLHELLEGLIADKELPAKDKRKRMKQVWWYCWERKVISWGEGGGRLCVKIMAVRLLSHLHVPHPTLQFQRSYPDVYRRRFPTEESEAAVIPEKAPRFKPPLSLFSFKKPLQPFQRSWSFRA